jgi:hypothetical protein
MKILAGLSQSQINHLKWYSTITNQEVQNLKDIFILQQQPNALYSSVYQWI